jgi:hypothetical protein
MRSHVSNLDNYLKRMVIALEDDVMAQFYNPAFQSVRRASRFWDVNFSQVETTTILTNNRAFAKVQPAATMEFDLPKRDILLKEGFQGAKALAQTYGELLNDKTFLSAVSMFAPDAGHRRSQFDQAANRSQRPAEAVRAHVRLGPGCPHTRSGGLQVRDRHGLRNPPRHPAGRAGDHLQFQLHVHHKHSRADPRR